MVKSPYHIPIVASLLTDETCLSTRHAIHQPPLSTCPSSHDYGLQLPMLKASKCTFELIHFWPPNSHNHGLQVHLLTCSITSLKCISNHPRLTPPNVSTTSLNHHLGVHLYFHSITASKCISKYPRLPPPSASPYPLDPGLGV
jgi:hypothetical protein